MKRAAILTLLLAGCTAPTGGGQNLSALDTWAAGDSLTSAPGSWATQLGFGNIARGGTGFVTAGTSGTIGMRVAAMLDLHDDPTTLLVMGGRNDETVGVPLTQVIDAVTVLHDSVEARGVDVRFVTPVPRANNWPTPLTDALRLHQLATWPDTIDCGPAVTSWEDSAHPDAVGQQQLADCIEAEL